MKPTPTDEQVEIIEKIRSTSDNLMINALAGTGKTTTLELIEEVTKPNRILYLCFNKRNADEAKDKFPETTVVRTMNGCGYRIWVPTIGRTFQTMKVDGKKNQNLLRTLIDDSPKNVQSVFWDVFWEVISGVSMAKSLGYIPEGKYPNAKRLTDRETLHATLDEEPDEIVADLIDEILFASIKSAYDGYIDFDDQVYMPALFGGTFPRFPNVWTDETQDLNPINHAMLDKLVRGRFVAVGDDAQSIYAFRGAVQGGMAKLQAKFKMQTCDLSTSFRCPQAVVEASRWRVPHFKWIKPGGHVETLNRLLYRDIPDDATIICRNNAPLFSLGLRLLGQRRSITIAGSEVGPKVLAIIKKLGDESMKRASLLSAIEDWRAQKIARQSSSANDIADCMKVFASFGETLGSAVSYAEHLFKQQGAIRLMTGHKAKGLEFNTVYHLDPFLIGDSEQEQNLRYVITTRAKERLFEIESANIHEE